MGEQKERIRIEEVAKSFGIKNIRVVNAFNQRGLQKAVRELDKKPGVSVLVSRGMCRLLMKKMLKRKGREFPVFQIEPNEKRSLAVLDKFACPAIREKGGKYAINPEACWGCSVCSQIAPPGAIKPGAAKGKGVKE